MKLFADTSDVLPPEIINRIDGVTTNPSLIAKKTDVPDILAYLLDRSSDLGPQRSISVQVTSNDEEEIVRQGLGINLYGNIGHPADTGGNWVVKVPINTSTDGKTHVLDGYHAIHALASYGIKVNATLVFSVEQALAAAVAGARFISPFIGRIDDLLAALALAKGHEEFKARSKSDYFPAAGVKGVTDEKGIRSGVDLIKNIDRHLRMYGLRSETRILAASARNARQVYECKQAGADIATLPMDVLQTLDTRVLEETRFDPEFLSAELGYGPFPLAAMATPDILRASIKDRPTEYLTHKKGIEGMVGFMKDTPERYRAQLEQISRSSA